jgi:hypothetical protein
MKENLNYKKRYSLVINCTKIKLNEHTIRFLNKSLKHNLLCKHKYWIVNLTVEAETVIGMKKIT